MRLHRISLARYARSASEAFNGRGGLLGKGRWHSAGQLVVYASEHASLAMAECLVHLQRADSIEPYVRWEIDIPDVHVAGTPEMPAGWTNAFEWTRAFGDKWIQSNASVAQLIPSAMVPTERNCLINPAHPQFQLGWVVSGPHPFSFDARLTRP
jgi:RES domain-containing protein